MAIKPTDFYDHLSSYGVNFFTGVPDSLLKEFCLCIDDHIPIDRHIIAANEGNAIALAAGYYLAKKSLPLVYMQNSGLGNAVNPLLSLCDPNVYSIPMLLLIGWRGEPGIQDESQHVKQGKIQLDLLRIMDIPYEIISKDEVDVKKKIDKGITTAIKGNCPFAIVVKKGTFDTYEFTPQIIYENLMSREESLDIILNQLSDESIIVSTTGNTSREIFEIREKNGQPHIKDFLTVGSMGHCSSIALGIAIAKPDKKVFCIDGDGALIMHMGSLSTIGNLKPKNLHHILINNYVHESVGGQKTTIKSMDVPNLIKSAGYKNVFTVDDRVCLKDQIINILRSKGPTFLEVKVKPGSKDDLGRPTVKPIENKKAFMKFIQGQ